MDPFASSDLASRVEGLIGPRIADVGYDLLLCDWVGGSTPVLWVYIERPDGEPVDIGDCVAVNNAITDFLDAQELIPGAYELRVSSPGVERPLKTPAHFTDCLGQLAKVRSWEPIEGRRNWKGTLRSVDDDLLTIEVDGQDHRIPIPAIERANLVWVAPPKGQKKGGNRRKKRNQR